MRGRPRAGPDTVLDAVASGTPKMGRPLRPGSMDITVAEISRVKTGTPEEKKSLLERLLATGSDASLGLMVEALGDPDWTVRRFAAEKLAARGPSVLERLGKVLAAGDDDQKYWAVRAMVGIGRDAVPLLLRLLGKGPKGMRTHAAQALGEIGDPVAVPYLVEALGDPVWPVRYEAFEGLVGFGEAALKDLTGALFSDNEDKAYWAAKALGKLGEKSREILLQALKTANRRLRFVIAAALGETGDTRVIKVLIHYTSDKSWIVRKRAADALAEIGATAVPLVLEAMASADEVSLPWLVAALCKMGPKGLSPLAGFLVARGEAFAWNVKDALTGLGAVALPLFLELARHPDRDLRFFAVTCLGEAPSDPKVDEALLAALKDESWSIRKVAAEALAGRGTGIVGRLAEAMEAGNEDLRYWVCVVLRKMGSAGVDQLVAALQDSNSNVAYFAASALAEVREERVVRPLIRALASPSWPVRNAASTSLALLGELAVTQLVNSIEDEHEDVAFWVGKTIKRLGRVAMPGVLFLLKRGNDEQRFYAARALGTLKDPAAFEALAEALKDGHEWVRLYAAIALGEIGDERSLAQLLGVLQDPSFKVHPRMVGVFSKFGDKVVPQLLDMARNGTASTRANALFVLGARRIEAAFPDLAKVAQDVREPVETRVAAIQALGHFKGRLPAIEALGAVARSEPAGLVRTKAILALGEFEEDAATVALLKAHSTSEGKEDEARVVNILVGAGPKLIPVLIDSLGHQDVGVRKAAAEVLERMGAAALPYLQTASMEGDQNVRFWAQKLTKKLREAQVGPRSGPGAGESAPPGRGPEGAGGGRAGNGPGATSPGGGGGGEPRPGAGNPRR